MPESGDNQSKPAMQRRRLGALSGAAVMASVAGARAQSSKPLVIGVLKDSSGPRSDLPGNGAVISAEMAVEDFGGSILGRPITLLRADHQAKSDLGIGVAASFDVGITTVAIVLRLAQENRLTPTPVRDVPKARVAALQAGQVTGRVVLVE